MAAAGIGKTPTGVHGLDEILAGGLPTGRPSLVCGSAGCGKTLLSMEFLVRGAMEFDEPGLFVAFEENAQELAQNVASLGFDLPKLVAEGKLLIDQVTMDPEGHEQIGEFDLEGLFVRIGYQLDQIGAKRIVLDTMETLFASFGDSATLRAELVRLFRWLKDRGVTAVITGERGEGQLTRHGLEEYVSDCVILLDNRVYDQITTRRLRVVKYRGTAHGTNEFPFLIDETGFSVLPITSIGLAAPTSNDRLSTGIPRLDTMLGGRGFYKGSSILVTGTAGTGKSTLISHIINAACARGERAIYFSLEESASQIIRNMRTVGIDLQQWVDKGLLRIDSSRPQLFGLEMHLVSIHRQLKQFQPSVVAIDPVSNLENAGTPRDANSAILRLVDLFRTNQITGIFTTLTEGGNALESTDVGISSIMDTWLLLKTIEHGGERNRGLYVMKSRGMPHSNQIREYVITGNGIELVDVYVGTEGVLTGTARLAQEARETADLVKRRQEAESKKRQLERKRAAMQARIAIMQAEHEAEELELELLLTEYESGDRKALELTEQMTKRRQADANGESN